MGEHTYAFVIAAACVAEWAAEAGPTFLCIVAVHVQLISSIVGSKTLADVWGNIKNK